MRRRHLRQAVSPVSTAVDLTPLIDIVFLLLVFFILTTSFDHDDKVLASLMPPQGQANHPSSDLPPPTIRIAVVPAGLPSHRSEADYERHAQAWRGQRIDRLSVRVGGEEVTTIDLAILRQASKPLQMAELTRVHAAIHAALAHRETDPAASRTAAPPIEIHAWSGLPWAGVTTVFDAVRAYEAAAFGARITEQAQVALARRVAFAPPGIRNHTQREDGRELYQILHLR